MEAHSPCPVRARGRGEDILIDCGSLRETGLDEDHEQGKYLQSQLEFSWFHGDSVSVIGSRHHQSGSLSSLR